MQNDEESISDTGTCRCCPAVPQNSFVDLVWFCCYNRRVYFDTSLDLNAKNSKEPDLHIELRQVLPDLCQNTSVWYESNELKPHPNTKPPHEIVILICFTGFKNILEVLSLRPKIE